MIIRPYKGKNPRIHETAYIAEGAVVIGDVEFSEDASLWFHGVARGDQDRVVVGRGSNIQDGCTLHVSRGRPCIVGEMVVAGHGAVIHGCVVGDCSMVGIGSVILDGAVIGEGSIVAAGTIVPPGKKFPARAFILGVPGRHIRDVTDDEYQNNIDIAGRYIERSREYRDIVFGGEALLKYP